MKKIIRTLVIETFALWLSGMLASGLIFQEGVASLFITGLALTLATFVIKPVINILILPLNMITLGLFKWVAHAVTLFLVDLILAEFSVSAFVFSGAQIANTTLPAFSLPAGVFAYCAFSFLISAIAGVFYWISK